MEIRLKIDETIDVNQLVKKIKWMELDFSTIHSLQGNKELLEQSFQDTKKELLNG
jgi:hypothetical protein